MKEKKYTSKKRRNIMLNNWATTRSKYGYGLFHNKYIGLRIPSFVYFQLKKEAHRRNMKLSTFVKFLLEKAVQDLKKEQN